MIQHQHPGLRFKKKSKIKYFWVTEFLLDLNTVSSGAWFLSKHLLNVASNQDLKIYRTILYLE